MILEYDDFDLSLVEYYCFKLHRTTIESEMDIPCPITESQDIYELMNNNDIEESVKNFFYYSDDSFSKELQDYFFKKYPFYKDKNINILPFSLRLFGAFFNRSYIFSLLMNCSDGVNGKRLIIDDKEINSFSELAPYLLNYAKGFKYGYENFINEYVCQNLIIDDKIEKNKKIFDFITNKNIFNQITCYNNHKKFYDNILVLENAEIEGKFFGFVYKAWSLIFSNFKNYKNLFNDYLQPSNERILNQKINNGIDIIDVLIIQLDAIIKLFKKDIDANETKFIYYIQEKDVTFLDDKLLKQYLARTKIENFIFLKNILDKVNLIIRYYKTDFETIPIKEFEFEQIFQTNRINCELRTYQDFYILILCYDKAVTINNESLRIKFFKESNYKEHSHVSIYYQCKILRELIITAYPDLDNKVEVDKPLNEIEIRTHKNKSKELHNHIFVNNAFEVWQSMFDEFNINESKRSDVKFMFEIMRKEKMIYDTVKQVSFLKWISETYEGMIIEKTSNYSKTITRMNAFNRAKELYKN